MSCCVCIDIVRLAFVFSAISSFRARVALHCINLGRWLNRSCQFTEKESFPSTGSICIFGRFAWAGLDFDLLTEIELVFLLRPLASDSLKHTHNLGIATRLLSLSLCVANRRWAQNKSIILTIRFPDHNATEPSGPAFCSATFDNRRGSEDDTLYDR